MLVDEIDITLSGGRGGGGIVSFGKKVKSGPDGGNGGKGGDLFVSAVSDVTALNQYVSQPVRSAEDGSPGGKNKKTGKNGKDLTVFVPIGTTLIDKNTKESFVFEKPGETKLVALGGTGGRGNWEFRSPTNTTPKTAEEGKEGQVRELKAILKLIADFGLVGLPNAGKSSLLNELTSAKAKVADYAFTTISPNLGVFEGKIIADIPGLIKGASLGKGLGTSFLKHIEKVNVLLHCIPADSPNPLEDYQIVRQELAGFSRVLLEKEELLVVTKSDTITQKEEKKLTKILKSKSQKLVFVSIYNYESIESLRKLLRVV